MRLFIQNTFMYKTANIIDILLVETGFFRLDHSRTSPKMYKI